MHIDDFWRIRALCRNTNVPSTFLIAVSDPRALHCIAWHGIARYDRKVKRRVVKRAFYSSEEDESTEEEFEEKNNSVAAPEVSPIACAGASGIASISTLLRNKRNGYSANLFPAGVGGAGRITGSGGIFD